MKLGTFGLLFDLLYLHGIPGLIRHDSRILSALHTASIALMVWGHLHATALYYVDYKTCVDFGCAKVITALVFWRIVLLTTWYSIYLKRRKLSILVRAVERWERRLKNTRNKVIVSVNVTIVGLSLFLIYLHATMGLFLWSRSKVTDYIFQHLFFLQNSPNLQPVIKLIASFLFYFFNRPFIYYCPPLVCLFYISWCFVLSQELKACGRHLNHLFRSTPPKNRFCFVQNFVNSYGRIHNLATLTESALSMQIFWLNSANFFILFIHFSRFLGMYTYRPSLAVQSTWFPFLQGWFYFSIIYCASKVHQQDLNLRKLVLNVIFQLRISEPNQECRRLLTDLIKSRKILIFSAFGMFDFTKGFLLTSLGVLISYNLLFLQLKKAI